MKKEEETREERKEERFFIPNLSYANRAGERELTKEYYFIKAIHSAGRHNAMACHGD